MRNYTLSRFSMENTAKYIDMLKKVLILKYEEIRAAIDIDAAMDFYENAFYNVQERDSEIYRD